MPTTLHKYDGDDYEYVSTKDILVGDIVIHKSWLANAGSKITYEIVYNNPQEERIYGIDPRWDSRSRNSDYRWNYSSNFGYTGWLRKVTEYPYDPTQMGDQEDDI